MTAVEAQAELRRKMLVAARQRRMTSASGQPLPPVFFLTDPDRTPRPEDVAGALPRGWGVIYRHFGAPDRLAVARRLSRIARQRGLVLLVAADPVLARRTGADGVHWPEGRLAQRLRLPSPRPGWIETASAHSRRAAAAALEAGIAAVILSPVFPSRSPSATRPIGPVRFRQWVSSLPDGAAVYGLGGITPATAARLPASCGLAAIDGLQPFADSDAG